MNYISAVLLRLFVCLLLLGIPQKVKINLVWRTCFLFYNLLLTTRLLDVYFKYRNWRLIGLQLGKNLLLHLSH